jgi:hypothetical protein
MKGFYFQEVCLSTLLTEIASLYFLMETVFHNRLKTELYPQRSRSIGIVLEDPT